MPSTYTLNNGIELIGTGEQSGTWGDTTNINFQLVDTALDGQVSISLTSTGTDSSPNLLEVSDGATSNGRNRLVIFTGTPGAASADVFVRLDPNDAEKIIYVRNDLGGTRTLKLFQGTYSASNDYEVPAGTTAVVFFNGAGTGAVAANVFNNAFFDSLRLGGESVDKILDEDNMASNDAAALATQQSIKAYVDSQVGTVDTLSEILANGNTTGGNDILFADNDKAIFGDGSDLQIYHDGSNSIVADVGTGNLELRGNNLRLTNAGGNELYLNATSNGDVDLYYDSAIKLSTTTTGVDITGTAVTDGLTVAGNMSVDGGTIKLDGNYPIGTGNVALGNTALDDGSLSGAYNTAVGSGALTANTTGQNDAFGASALLNNTTGTFNTAIGASTLFDNVSGSNNVAVGRNALENNTTASGNTMAGYQAGYIVGNEIVATAIVSGVNYTIQTLGTTDFTLIGAGSNTVGTTFTATGAGTGTGTASANANYNTFVGHQSGDVIVGGSKNSILGRFDGNQGGLDIRNSDNHIVLSDGDGNPRLYFDDSGNMAVDTDTLYVDSANNRVGVGTASPDGNLTLGSTTTSGDISIRIKGDATSRGFLMFGDAGGAQLGDIMYDHSDNHMRFRVNNAEAMRIDLSQHVLIGHTSGISHLGEQHELQVTDTNFSLASFSTYRNGSDGAMLALSHSRNATKGSQTILNADDNMGGITFFGSDGTDFARGAQIRALVDGSPANNDMPGRIIFATSSSGTDSPTERMRIANDGKVSIGTVGTSSQAKVQINGGADGSGILTGRTDGGNGNNERFILTGFADGGGSGYGGGIGFKTRDTVNVFHEAMRIDSSQRVLIGNGISSRGSNLNLQVEGTGFAGASASFTRNSNDASPPALRMTKSRSGSTGGVTVVQENDNLGQLQYQGTDGSTAYTAAAISGEVDDEPGSTDMPGRLVFSTTSNGGTSPTERMRINNAGTVIINRNLTGGYTPLIVKGERSSSTTLLSLETEGTGQNNDTINLDFKMNSGADSTERVAGRIGVLNVTTGAARGNMIFSVLEDAGNLIEAMTIDDDGKVGIGTNNPLNTLNLSSTSPQIRLDDTDATGYSKVSGSAANIYLQADEGNTVADTKIDLRVDGGIVAIFDGDGLKFNGDTAAANALDDYEEGLHVTTVSAGTGTPTVASAEDSVSYTKIGNEVFINGQIGTNNCSGCSGAYYVTMPFVTQTLAERSDYYFAFAHTNVDQDIAYFYLQQTGGGSSTFQVNARMTDGTNNSNVATLLANAGNFDISIASMHYKTAS